MKHDLSLIEISRELERVGCGIVVSRPGAPAKLPPAIPGHIAGHRKAMEAIEAVSAESGVPASEIIGRSRAILATKARQRAIREVAKAVDWSPVKGKVSSYWTSSRIGELFGIDHTAVLYALGRRGIHVRKMKREAAGGSA